MEETQYQLDIQSVHRFPAPSSKSARIGYATEGALGLYLRAAVHRRGQRPPKGLGI